MDSDRHTPPRPDRLFPQIKHRSPLHHPQSPIANSLNIKQRSSLATHKTERLFPQIQQRCPSPNQNPIS
ncbi:MAG: hypothetical protein IM537_16355 [Pseudanabaena sp. M57BS1SP1A06MG]|nr:hypothetical protein [Pseudanabaena sp. M53BS1SP1A06MG]MCA6581440.1 hypothetical protein [Pseudanabaena sp. M34BS1SP1A06MG]MCA6591263.1 hypothetical protein [Pseudanabaena sp. M38BS1SP1A06MG]MCA6601725.1 hypothetical protein [Pseudanabaena sp. M57BS1SP1A06MG]